MALSKLSGYEQRILFTQLCNVLEPRIAVRPRDTAAAFRCAAAAGWSADEAQGARPSLQQCHRCRLRHPRRCARQRRAAGARDALYGEFPCQCRSGGCRPSSTGSIESRPALLTSAWVAKCTRCKRVLSRACACLLGRHPTHISLYIKKKPQFASHRVGNRTRSARPRSRRHMTRATPDATATVGSVVVHRLRHATAIAIGQDPGTHTSMLIETERNRERGKPQLSVAPICST